MESKEKSPVGSPRSPVASPGRETTPKSPVGSPGEEEAPGSPERSVASPTSGNLLPGNYWTEAPPLDDENPEVESDLASSTASLSSSVMHYRTIQGRTFHSDRGNAKYWVSNDEKANDALDLFHHAHTLILDGKLFLAPLKTDNIQKVVDIATGTGSWAIDFADEFPNCEVVGTDISPIQPSWIPPNLKFEIDDCTQSWTFSPDSIDFVHLRYMIGSIKDWPALFKEAYRCIKPGGYIESFDPTGKYESDDGTVKQGSAMEQWGEFLEAGGKAMGQSFRVVQDDLQRLALEEAGFVNIEYRDFKVPSGTWPKDPNLKQVGLCAYSGMSIDVEGYMVFMAELLGWSQEEVLVFAAHFRREIRDPNIHGYYRVRVAWGMKPDA